VHRVKKNKSYEYRFKHIILQNYTIPIFIWPIIECAALQCTYTFLGTYNIFQVIADLYAASSNRARKIYNIIILQHTYYIISLLYYYICNAAIFPPRYRI